MGHVNGCFYQPSTTGTNGVGYATSIDWVDNSQDGIGFDANRSNSTYQNGGTIRPKSMSILVLLKL